MSERACFRNSSSVQRILCRSRGPVYHDVHVCHGAGLPIRLAIRPADDRSARALPRCRPRGRGAAKPRQPCQRTNRCPAGSLRHTLPPAGRRPVKHWGQADCQKRPSILSLLSTSLVFPSSSSSTHSFRSEPVIFCTYQRWPCRGSTRRPNSCPTPLPINGHEFPSSLPQGRRSPWVSF